MRNSILNPVFTGSLAIHPQYGLGMVVVERIELGGPTLVALFLHHLSSKTYLSTSEKRILGAVGYIGRMGPEHTKILSYQHLCALNFVSGDYPQDLITLMEAHGIYLRSLVRNKLDTDKAWEAATPVEVLPCRVRTASPPAIPAESSPDDQAMVVECLLRKVGQNPADNGYRMPMNRGRITYIVGRNPQDMEYDNWVKLSNYGINVGVAPGSPVVVGSSAMLYNADPSSGKPLGELVGVTGSSTFTDAKIHGAYISHYGTNPRIMYNVSLAPSNKAFLIGVDSIKQISGITKPRLRANIAVTVSGDFIFKNHNLKGSRGKVVKETDREGDVGVHFPGLQITGGSAMDGDQSPQSGTYLFVPEGILSVEG